MPLSYEIVEETPQVRVSGTEAVTMPEMIGIMEEVAADTRFHSDFTVTLDLRMATYTAELSDGDALAAVLNQKKMDFRNKVAVIVPQSLHFLVRLYCALTALGGFDKIQCFTSMDEALKWCRTRK